jgi:hypothetical protein
LRGEGLEEPECLWRQRDGLSVARDDPGPRIEDAIPEMETHRDMLHELEGNRNESGRTSMLAAAIFDIGL